MHAGVAANKSLQGLQVAKVTTIVVAMPRDDRITDVFTVEGGMSGAKPQLAITDS